MSDTSTKPTAETMTLVGCRHDRSWVIAISGELDLSCGDTLSDAFARASEQSCDRVVVDASGVTFMDCGGLHVLLEAAAGSGGEVWLREPSRSVRTLIELAGLANGWNAAMTGGEVRIP